MRAQLRDSSIPLKPLVCFDHQIFAAQVYGGVSRYVYEIAARIPNISEFSTRIVAPVAVNAYLQSGRVNRWGVSISPQRSIARYLPALNKYLGPTLVRLARPTLVHETYYSERRSAPASCPTVLTVHDMVHEKYSNLFVASQETSRAKRAAVDRADLIVCVSESTRRDLVELFHVSPARTRVVHHGYSLIAPDATRAATPKSIVRPYVLYVGARTKYKNFERLLKAFASSSRLKRDFHLVAFGGGGFTSAEAAQIMDLGLSELIIQVAGDDALLATIYREAALLVYPSLYEGFGIPLLEAMQFRCPVTCSNTSSLPEVAGNAAHMFDPTSCEEIASSMEIVAYDAATRERLVANGESRLSQFSWDDAARSTASIYREVLSGGFR